MNHTSLKNRIKGIVLILLFMVPSAIIMGQRREDTPPLKERLFYGGNFGLQFGTITDIEVSPVIGLWVLPRIAVAVGPDYRFYKYFSEKTHVYGGKTYAEFVLLRNINSVIPIGSNTNIIVHVEDEFLNLESAFWKDPSLTYPATRFYVNTVLAGGGLSQQVGRRSSLNIVALWALNESAYGLYGNPEIRISFLF